MIGICINKCFLLDIKCHCMMGLFPEIDRAWLTIDSDIYVSLLNVLINISLICNVFKFRFGPTKMHATSLISTG